MNKRSLWLIRLLALLLTFMPQAIAAETKTTISCKPQSVIVAVGDTTQIKPAVSPASAQRSGVEYHSTDEAVATVDRSGRIRGRSEGMCKVVIVSRHDTNAQLHIPVQVVKPVEKLTATIEADTLMVGETTRLVCTFEPSDATLPQATFASSEEDVATVDENGVITAVSKGKTEIVVRSVDGAARARLRVEVQQQPTGIRLPESEHVLAIGKSTDLKATVLPRNVNNKRVVWFSADEAIATVDAHGKVQAVSVGRTTVTAAAEGEPSVQAQVEITVVKPAQSVAFEHKTYSVNVGETIHLSPVVLPEDASSKAVSYKVKNPKIATVDENGVVTAHKKGKTTVTATLLNVNDSRRRATCTIEVLTPVTGAHLERESVRVGVDNYTYVTAVLEPSNASDRRMIWRAADPTLIRLKGDTNKVRVSGRKWGRTQLTGTTVDGGYTVTMDVNVGSLRHAVGVESIRIRNGKPYIVLKNHSNMQITAVLYKIIGTDEQNNPIRLSRLGKTLYGSYDLPLAPNEKTEHGRFTFYDAGRYQNLQSVSIAITGWETSTGYSANNGETLYAYEIPESQQEWITWQSELYTEIQSNPRAN